MKKAFAAILMSVLLAAGCVTSDSDSDKDSDGTGNDNVQQTIFSITGRIKDASDAFIAGATVTLIGPNTQRTVTTNNYGIYTFIELSKGDYTVAPAKEGYSFEPPMKTVSITTTDIADLVFIATATGNTDGNSGGETGGNTGSGTYTISGRALDDKGNAIVGASVLLVSKGKDVITGTDGSYSFANLAPGSYVVSIDKDGYTFAVDYKLLTITDANVASIDFIGVLSGQTALSHTVYGKVVDVDGNPLLGVTICLEGDYTLETSTDATGSYLFLDINNGTYTVRPIKTGYTFTPEIISAAVHDADVTIATFTGRKQSEPGSGNAGSALYLPFKIGATWNTRETVKNDFFEDTIDYIDTITGTATIGGKLYWESVMTYNDEYGSTSDTGYLRVEDNTLYTFYEGLDAGKAVAKAGAGKIAAVLKTADLDTEVPLYKTGVSAGTTWDVFSTTVSGGGETTDIKVTGKCLGKESVSVPAGTFKDCVKLEITHTFTMTGGGETTKSVLVQNVWLAANVGMVRTTGETTVTSSYGAYKTSMNEVLTGYSIP